MKAVSRRTALISLGGFGIGLTGTSAIGASWLRDDRQPALTILGCGRGLSVLLTSGGARMLQLAGTDSTDFGNALSNARFPLLDRIDVLLVPGEEPNISLVKSALRQVDSRNVYSIGTSRHLLDAGIAVDREMLVPYKLTLPSGTVMTVSGFSDPAASNASLSSWYLLVRWGNHQVLIDSGGDIDRLPHEARNASAWIRTSGAFSAEDIKQVEPSAILVAAETIEGFRMRELIQQESGRPVYGYRVHGGDIARLQLGADGLHLPGNPASAPDRD